MVTIDSNIETLLQQTQTALDQENWSWINDTWQNFLADPKQLSKLNVNQRQTLTKIALELLVVGDFQIRWHLTKWFPKLGEDCLKSLQLLLTNLETSADECWFAVKMLGEFDTPDVVLTLADLLNETTDPDLKAIAAQSLAKLGLSAINILTQLLEKEASRFGATQALAQINDPQVIESLLTVVRDANPQIREMAVEALGQFSDRRVFPILKIALLDLNAQVRKKAVIAIGLRSEFGPERLENLKPLLFDLNLEVCQQTAIALSRLQTPEAAAALGQILESSLTPLPLQIQAIQALGWLELSASLNYLNQILNNNDLDPSIYLEIIRILGRYRDQSLQSEALQCLLMFWQSGHGALENALIRQTLAQSLGQCQQTAAVPILQILSNDSETSVRLQAIASLKKLG